MTAHGVVSEIDWLVGSHEFAVLASGVLARRRARVVRSCDNVGEMSSGQPYLERSTAPRTAPFVRSHLSRHLLARATRHAQRGFGKRLAMDVSEACIALCTASRQGAAFLGCSKTSPSLDMCHQLVSVITLLAHDAPLRGHHRRATANLSCFSM